MNTTVQKWGNSLALRIPKAVARELQVVEGDAVELKIRGDLLQVKPARREYRLSDLVAKMSKGKMHLESDWGGPVGKELW
jgi:antitoxin MazE